MSAARSKSGSSKTKAPESVSLEVERVVTISNSRGLHARAAAKFVRTTGEYKAEVHVETGGNRVNGRSIMGLLMLGAARGTQVTLSATGEDAKDALAALVWLVEDGFGES